MPDKASFARHLLAAVARIAWVKLTIVMLHYLLDSQAPFLQDILEEVVQARGYSHVRLDGTMSSAVRQRTGTVNSCEEVLPR